ncbi:M48 family metallopeptidase [Pseudoduganella armeniaca]|uniref:Peptidase M48 domain-containing protein n=1 Tax=Pseudoduganella armeniaca TaxID=2072590 RepID=A0A2R4CAX2_9BURK|nr:M48 family metallopeptidase [Pseudoduganella armeniaca]AVR96751.1 hypothetical protein C9I28_14515 [Pseudoduganella armeniaca]
MEQQRYLALIERLEYEACTWPRRFRARVLLVSLGLYGAELGLLLAAWLGCHALLRHLPAVDATLVAAVLGALAALALKWLLWPRLPAPQGRALTRAEAPALFDALDRMRARMAAPPIHHVLVDARYNVAVLQRPRWGGLWGRRTNYLMVGLPYLLAVSTSELFAALAHELGHLGGANAPLDAWVYRQRRVVGALHERLQERGGVRWLDAMLAYYHAVTFVLARRHEFAADRAATTLVGAAVNARGLVRDTLQMRWLHETFWPTLLRHADRGVRPPFMPYTAMRTAFRAGHAQWARPERLEAALAQRSGRHDTHPCLRERLAAIGVTAALPPALERTAADVLLGPDATRRLVAEFDALWWRREGRDWEQRYHQASAARQRMQALAACDVADLAPTQLEELALLTTEFDTPQAARPLLARVLAQPGQHPRPRSTMAACCSMRTTPKACATCRWPPPASAR